MRIGIDVGGTNTDAVLMHGATVVAKIKTSTTADVMSGIVTAIESLLRSSGLDRGDLTAVMIGTTHFTNAVIERRRLAPTAIVRLGLPAAQAVDPFDDWPEDLRAAIGAHWRLAHGGNEYDGRELSALDPAEISRIGRELVGEGVKSVAVTAVFSPVTPTMEQHVAELLACEAPELTVTLSHEIGRLGLLERENATAINAALRPLAATTVQSFRRSLTELGIDAPLYLTQNDGTLMSSEMAERYPVLTFASGPTNSMRGAAFLSGLADALVLDVGGTTSDIGALVHGFPRESAVSATFGDVRTNFRMPDLISFGLGGGSVVRGEQPRLGPDSVGYAITDRALVFGGDTLTATDLAVAGGRAQVGEPALASGVDPALAQRGLDLMRAMTEDALDRIKLARHPEPVIVVGGGSILVDDQLAGASQVVRPEHYEVANAVGAAIAQVSGELDQIESLDDGRERILERARSAAIDRAVANGAVRDSVRIVEVEDAPVPYMEDRMLRVRVKAVGELADTTVARSTT
ncbi:hydantoinase/oxoprolinase family protein [Conexibacter woesei]|uniref:Hydantoinase/oxoprolinase n=1 Tax=Conexibacter woesei (strain DSM 14684 / CCUG 47730 / CIP 108061 / JCM 11494 / NBRC 100937 / ID131577) TaxID=469383 RepID=D3F599_CONWI|nr:hydantoinase/oxoprolinase family protein [Conexibacter woesei]ADB50566.1 Hydantoinase/oxoprolinase [Conexibacter woesei DSM 14684]